MKIAGVAVADPIVIHGTKGGVVGQPPLEPIGILTVLSSVKSNLQDIECKIFDHAMLRENTIPEIEKFNPDVVFLGLAVTSHYNSFIDFLTWAENKKIPVLAGGYHFTICNMAELAAKKLKTFICYDDGEQTAVEFIRYLRGENKLTDIPNLFAYENGQLIKTKRELTALLSQRYPLSNFTLEEFDPRKYWIPKDTETMTYWPSKFFFDGKPAKKRVMGPRLMSGCKYRYDRAKSGKETCAYCSYSSEFRIGDVDLYWGRVKEMYKYVESIPWYGSTICHTIGYAYNDVELIRKLWEKRDPDIKMAFKVYLMGLRDDVGRMLKDMNVCWGYVGADGKPGYTHEWSYSHPLVKMLEVARKYGINIEIGFVIGRRDHSWKEIDMWKKFRDRLLKEYSDIISYMRAAAQIVFPDSPDWYLLCNKFPEFSQTDNPDLLEARLRFYEEFTSLGKDGSKILKKLYEVGEEFKFVSHQSFWGGYA